MDASQGENLSIADITYVTKAFLRYFRRKVWLFFVVSTIGTLLGLFYYFVQKPKYEGVCTFILEEKSTGGGGIAGLASQFGFDLGGLTSGGSIFSGDNILDILKSKKIVYKVLLSKVDEDQVQSNQSTLADVFLESEGWKKKWSDEAELKDIHYRAYKEGQTLSIKQDSVIGLIHESLLKRSLIAERQNKKGSIIRVVATSSNSQFAKLLTERLVTEASKLYLDIKIGTAQANISQMQRRSDSLLGLLNRKSFTIAVSQPLDINPGIKSALVPTEIATRDRTVLATLYSEVTKNLEASKLILAQQTPIIRMLDKPGPVLENKKFKIPFLLFTAFFLSALIFVIVQFLYFLVFQYNRLPKTKTKV